METTIIEHYEASITVLHKGGEIKNAFIAADDYACFQRECDTNYPLSTATPFSFVAVYWPSQKQRYGDVEPLINACGAFVNAAGIRIPALCDIIAEKVQSVPVDEYEYEADI